MFRSFGAEEALIFIPMCVIVLGVFGSITWVVIHYIRKHW